MFVNSQVWSFLAHESLLIPYKFHRLPDTLPDSYIDNEDLESIACTWILGHTPFCHAGPECTRLFKRYDQTVHAFENNIARLGLGIMLAERYEIFHAVFKFWDPCNNLFRPLSRSSVTRPTVRNQNCCNDHDIRSWDAYIQGFKACHGRNANDWCSLGAMHSSMDNGPSLEPSQSMGLATINHDIWWIDTIWTNQLAATKCDFLTTWRGYKIGIQT